MHLKEVVVDKRMRSIHVSTSLTAYFSYSHRYRSGLDHYALSADFDTARVPPELLFDLGRGQRRLPLQRL